MHKSWIIKEKKKKKKFRIIDTYALSNNFKRINSPPRIDFDFSTFTACSRKLYINYYINCNNTIDNFFEIKIFPWNQCDWIQVRGIAERSREKTSDYLKIVGGKKKRGTRKRETEKYHIIGQPRTTAVVVTLTVLLSSCYHHMVASSDSASPLRLSSAVFDSFLERIRYIHARERRRGILVDKNAEKESKQKRKKDALVWDKRWLHLRPPKRDQTNLFQPRRNRRNLSILLTQQVHFL